MGLKGQASPLCGVCEAELEFACDTCDGNFGHGEGQNAWLRNPRRIRRLQRAGVLEGRSEKERLPVSFLLNWWVHSATTLCGGDGQRKAGACCFLFPVSWD